jgi:dihydrofolate synthase/folylpolyglutamate synthase
MIRVNAKPIAAHRLLLGLKEAEAKLKPLVGSPELTHYMLICVAAYDYFRESNVDFVVAETAIGGLYDPTTPFAPDVCMFTNVTREHEDVLGDTSAKIAQHKSRIIGQDSEVVLGEEITDDVERVISSYALQQRASVRRVDVESATSTGMICDHGGVKIFNGNRFCPDYQHPNLRLAAEAFVALGAGGGNGLWIDLDDSPPGLFPENRFEFRSRNGVTYLFDSAHNEDGFAKFAQALGRFFDLRELSFFIGPFRKDVMDSFHRIVRPNRVTFVSGYHPRVRKRDGFADLYSVDFDAEEYRIGNGAIVVLGMFLPAMVKAMLFPDERADTLAKYKGADGC